MQEEDFPVSLPTKRTPPPVQAKEFRVSLLTFVAPVLAVVFAQWTNRLAHALLSEEFSVWKIWLFYVLMFIANAGSVSAKAKSKSFGWWITAFLIMGEILVQFKFFMIGFLETVK